MMDYITQDIERILCFVIRFHLREILWEKMMKKHIYQGLFISGLMVLSGCASYSPSSQSNSYGFNTSCGFLCKVEPPVRISESNYMVSGSNGGGSITPKLLSAASGYCGALNRELLALNKEEEFRGGTTYGSVEFSCKSYQ